MSALLLVILALQPCLDVEATGAVECDWVTVEEVGHQRDVAVGGEGVGDELGVGEFVAYDIGDPGGGVRWC